MSDDKKTRCSTCGNEVTATDFGMAYHGSADSSASIDYDLDFDHEPTLQKN